MHSAIRWFKCKLKPPKNLAMLAVAEEVAMAEEVAIQEAVVLDEGSVTRSGKKITLKTL